MTPHLNCLVEMVQVRGHNICFTVSSTVQMRGSQHKVLCRINKNCPSLSPNTPSYLNLCKAMLSHFLERFGGYSDEPGICPSVSPSVSPSIRTSVNIFISAL